MKKIGGRIKRQKGDDLLHWYYRILPKRPKRITAGLRCAPPVGRRLGLGPSALQSRRLLMKSAIACACNASVPSPNPSLVHGACLRNRRALAMGS